jgi:cullin 1
MAVLLLFNEYEHLTVERMLDTTQLESELFVQVLISLLKSQVLICSEIAPEGLTEEFKETSIKMTYTIQVDENFKSRKIKINLNQPIKSVEQKDTETVNQSIDEDRKLLIQVNRIKIFYSFSFNFF